MPDMRSATLPARQLQRLHELRVQQEGGVMAKDSGGEEKRRICKLCPMPVEGMNRLCSEHKYLREMEHRKTENERRKKVRRELGLRQPGPKKENVPTQYAERLKETPEDIRDQAYQELRYLASRLGGAPEEGTSTQAAYRRMMGRQGALI